MDSRESLPTSPGDLMDQSQRAQDTIPAYEPSDERNHDDSPAQEQSDRPEESSMLDTTKEKPASRQHVSTLNKFWVVELTCALISCIAIVAIAALLFEYHDRPLQTWPSDRITINTTISLLSLVAKASMVLATTQAISQLKWSWFCQPTLRRVIDLQIFDNASRGPLGSLEFLARVSRSHLASVGAVVMLLSVALDPFAQQLLNFPPRSVQVGTPNARRAMSFESNNTAWYTPDGSVQTTGILNVLPESALLSAVYAGTLGSPPSLVANCPSGNCTWPPFTSLSFCSHCSTAIGQWDGNTTLARYTSQSNISWEIQPLQDGPTSNVHAFTKTNDTYSVAGFANPITGFARFPLTGVSRDPTFQSPSDFMSPRQNCTECALYFCVKQFNLSVTSGHPHLEVLSRHTNDSTSSSNGFIYLEQQNFSWSSTLSRYFEHQLAAGSSSYADLLSQISLADNVTQLMDSIALGMTNALMNNISSPSHAQAGIAYNTETYIHVRWAWLILPVLLALTTLIFLVLVMIQTSNGRRAIWKSSLLPLIFHPIRLEPEQLPGETIPEMERCAKTIQTQLKQSTDDRWEFVTR